MSGDIIRFLILVAVFASVFLLMQVLIRTSVDQRAHAGAINKRLKLIASGTDRQEIVRFLRKNDPMLVWQRGGPFSAMYVAFRRNLAMAAVPYTTTQVVIAMMAIFAAIVLVVATAAWSANYP